MPSIVLVPDFWTGAVSYMMAKPAFESKGYETETVVLPSTSGGTELNATMDDDIAAIREVVKGYVNDGKEVVMVCHGAGGYLGCSAIQGLTAKARRDEGFKGGVIKIFFIAAQLYEEGYSFTAPDYAEMNEVCSFSFSSSPFCSSLCVVTYLTCSHSPALYSSLTQQLPFSMT